MVYQRGMATSDPFAELRATAAKQKWATELDTTLAFERQELRSLLDIWLGKAAGGVPARSQFEMRTLKAFATHIIILERIGQASARRYKFRLFGSAHLKLFGEHTGRFLDEMVTAEMLPSWLAIYDAVLKARQPIRIVTHFFTPTLEFLRGEMLAAPVADASGLENMILAATYVGPKDAVLKPF